MPGDILWSRRPLEMVTFAKPSDLRGELAAPLLEYGVPKEMLGLYRAANELTLLEGSGGRQMLCFGSIAYSQCACLDLQTGAVVALMDTWPEVDEEVVFIVNSSLKKFIASVSAVLNRYPFDSPQATNESEEDYLDRTNIELHQAADNLKKSLNDIDPAALEDPGRFWLDFLDDVVMGNYSPTD